jgi:NADPH2:quinone reductase
VQDRRVVVTGASGGVGRFAVQIASHEGADVTAVVSRPERGSDLERLGAARVHVGMPEEGEFDIILESVGGPSLAAALDLVAPHGTIVSFGNSSGEATTFHPSRFYPRSGARLCAFVLLPELERLGYAALVLVPDVDPAAVVARGDVGRI